MHIAACDDVETRDVVEPGAKDVVIRVLIDESIGAPTFAMRRLKIAPGGCTPYHSHPWEHEVYVLSGKGMARRKDGEAEMKEGIFIYVPPGEDHNFVSTGTGPLIFLCIIPVADLRGRKALQPGA